MYIIENQGTGDNKAFIDDQVAKQIVVGVATKGTRIGPVGRKGIVPE